jgi:SAM-dependent methyltransferase
MTFDVSAAAYDRFMGAWSRLLVPSMIELTGLRAGQRALDVGCGPGTLTVELARTLGPGSVAAVDPSPAFVAATRDRAPGVDVREATVDALPFEDAAFDAAIAQLVVHFMPDPVGGLRQMARVTRAGGVVAACVWDYASGRGPLGPFWQAVLEMDPDAHDEAGLPGACEGHLTELFEAAGLRRVAETGLEVSREFESFDAWWTPFEIGAGPARSHLRSLDDAGRAALRERCRGMLPRGSFALTARAWAARGFV